MGLYDRDWYNEATKAKRKDSRIEPGFYSRSTSGNTPLEEEAFRGKAKRRKVHKIVWILLLAPWICLLLAGTLWIKHPDASRLQWFSNVWGRIQSKVERFRLQEPSNPILYRPSQAELNRGQPKAPHQSIPAPIPSQKTPVEFVIHANRQGHYRTVGTINGRQVNFLLDTGATFVSVPENLRSHLNLAPTGTRRTMTASDTYLTQSAVIDDLGIGSFLMKNVEADLNPRAQTDEILLGMSALKHFELVQRNGTLTLRAFVDHGQSQPPYSSAPAQATTQEPIEIKRSVRECMGTGKLINQQTINCMRGN